MKRMKTFFMYLLAFLAFFWFTNFIIFAASKTSYKPLNKYEIANVENPKITVEKAETTYINGYVKGKIENTSDEDLTGKYVKIDFYSERNNILGTKYIKIDNEASKNNQEFNIKYNYEGVDNIKISTTNEFTGKEFDLTSDPERNTLYKLGALLALFAFI